MRSAIPILLLAAFVRAEDDVGELLEPLVKEHEVPALGGAIVRSGALTALGVAGVRRAGGDEKARKEDVWHLGSCTKSMTATLIGRFVDRGEFRWDTALEAESWNRVTVDLLLRHRGGAPADLHADGLWARLWKREGTPVDQRALLFAGVQKRPPEAFGTYVYSNAGYAMAGHMLETARKTPWEDLMREELFHPLGMKSAGFGAPPKGNPWGHAERGGGLLPVPPGPNADNPPAIGPAGTVHASLRDWAKYVALHLEGARDGEAKLLLERGTLRRIQNPREGEDYAYGWIAAERRWGGGRVLTHAGSNTMWYCVVWMAPKKGFAVLATCNAGGGRGAKACDAVAAALIGRVRK